jgi:dihydropteroate synthase
VNPAAAPVAVSTPRSERLASLWPRRLPAVMGILNCTPDSFSDGGLLPDVQAAVAHAERLIDEGATIIDVGGESTRPGADPVAAEEEARRVIPVVTEIRRHHPETVLSIDTTKACVAHAALQAGADLVNDISGGTDHDLLATVAEHDAGIVIMHMRGSPRTMQLDTIYRNVVAEVHCFLLERTETAVAAGINPDLIWLDPGIGFGKNSVNNLEILGAVADLAALGQPVVVGASRKSFIGKLTGAEVHERLAGSLAALIPSIGIEKAVVRVHDVAPTVQFLTIATGVREVEE